MRSLLIILIALIVSCNPIDNYKKEKPVYAETENAVHDSVLAKKFGADKYGMKKYVMAFLKRGPNRDFDSIQTMNLQLAHLENIVKMAEDGKLVLTGPFIDSGEIRGIYIFNVESIEQARFLTETDPVVQAGSLIMELKEW